MYAVKALYDGVSFKPKQPIAIKEEYEVIITFVEPVKKDTVRPPFGLGCMKGKITEADDHDWFKPLDDFEEYM
jgi:predicted DNA-binding antitoxin AbrB/MazE fold protein